MWAGVRARFRIIELVISGTTPAPQHCPEQDHEKHYNTMLRLEETGAASRS